MGTVYLLVPKVRKDGYVPFFVSERRRSEQALIAVVQEAFVNRVSTRKIERLAHAMGIENISASRVSEFNKELDAQVEGFKARPLAEGYPFLRIDTLFQNVRVVSVFPSVESYVRLTICYLIEYSEDWVSERSYIPGDKAFWSLDRLYELTAQAAN